MVATHLEDERFVSITTFKRDGTPVSTPVWCAGQDGSLLVFSEADSWKVRRIRHDPHIRVTPCGASGRPHGTSLEAEATIADDTTTVEVLLARKYGVMWRGYRILMATLRHLRRQSAPKSVTIRITPR